MLKRVAADAERSVKRPDQEQFCCCFQQAWRTNRSHFPSRIPSPFSEPWQTIFRGWDRQPSQWRWRTTPWSTPRRPKLWSRTQQGAWPRRTRLRRTHHGRRHRCFRCHQIFLGSGMTLSLKRERMTRPNEGTHELTKDLQEKLQPPQPPQLPQNRQRTGVCGCFRRTTTREATTMEEELAEPLVWTRRSPWPWPRTRRSLLTVFC